MRNRGFTLIEVLIAFTILAVVLAVAFGGIMSGLSQERAARSTGARVLAARSIFAQLGVEVPLSEGVIEGRLATGEMWQVSVRRLSEDTGSGTLDLYVAELSMFEENHPVLNLSALKLAD